MPAKDPVVAIACVLFGSEATLPGMGGSADAGDVGEGEEEELGEAAMQPQSDMQQHAGHAFGGLQGNHQKVQSP